MPRLSVHLCGELVGHITPDESLDYQFQYVDGCEIPLSCSLPLQAEAFDRVTTRAFFRGLLPEEKRREQYVRQLKIEPDDDVALLDAIGGDCAGAVQIVSTHSPLDLPDIEYATDDLARFCDDIRSGALISQAARLSLTGAQLKEAVVLDGNGRIRIPRDGRPTTHILKVPPQPGVGDGYENVVLNEYLCLQVAKQISGQFRNAFRTAESSLLPFTYYPGGSPDYILCLKRFDREVNPVGEVDRLHQEDFCQATGRLQRYAERGGPDFADLARICNRFTANPGVNRLQIFYAAILNIVLGNCDAHGRNFSLARPLGSPPDLAPLYDIVSTVAYPALSRNMAMPAGDVYPIDDVDRACIRAIADSLQLSGRIAEQQSLELIELIIDVVQAVRDTINIESEILDEIVLQAVARAHLLR